MCSDLPGYSDVCKQRMYCSFCGAKNVVESSLFCGSCGGRYPLVEVKTNSIANPCDSGSGLSFEHFLATRKRKTTTTDQEFSQSMNAANNLKVQERKSGWRSTRKMKALQQEKVQIKIGLSRFVNGNLKPKRGSTLPLEVPKDISDSLLQSAAIKKHLAFNSQLPKDQQYILLYPDNQPVRFIPGTSDRFILQKYKECIGKPYQRITLYICDVDDFECFTKNSCESDEELNSTDSLDKTLDSSSEVSFHPKWAKNTRSTVATSHSSDLSQTSAECYPGTKETKSTVPTSHPISSTQTSTEFYTSTEGTSELSTAAVPKSSYSTYCDIVWISDDDNFGFSDCDEDDDDLQKAIFDSVTSVGNDNELSQDETTKQLLTDLMDSGIIDAVVHEAKAVGSKLDKSLGGGGKSGLHQFMMDCSKDSTALHVKACRILASAKDEEVSCIQNYLLCHYPNIFGWNSEEEMRIKGHYMTIATSNILNMIKEKKDSKKKLASDILKGIQVPQSEEFQVIRARRNHIWEDTLRTFQKPSFKVNRPLHVHFISEEAEDAGGPRREFFRLLLKELAEVSGILEGQQSCKTVTSNPLLVAKKVYYSAGVMVSTVLRQGGPGLCCLSSSVYNYISNQAITATIDDVVDYSTKSNIQMILNADKGKFSETIRSLANFLIECGLSKLNWSFNEKDALVEILCTHFVLHKNKVALDQFMEGLEAGGLLHHIQHNPLSMKEMFIYSDKKVTVAQFRSLLKYEYSPEGSNAREHEKLAVLWWEEILDEIATPSDTNKASVTLEELLKFTTGADCIPPCGFDSELSIKFYHVDKDSKIQRLPHASTCSMILYLPSGLNSYDEFTLLLEKSLNGYGGFGNV